MKVLIDPKFQNTSGAFNLANSENEALTLQNFLLQIDANSQNYKFLDHNKGEGFARAFYPSVDNGYMDTELIRNTGFNLTPI